MATKTETYMVDDIDGTGEGVSTVQFALHGATYEIDLSEDNTHALEESLAEFIDSARKISGRTQKVKSPTADASTPKASDVRSWAQENGIAVSARGRIPAPVVEQYQAATAA